MTKGLGRMLWILMIGVLTGCGSVSRSTVPSQWVFSHQSPDGIQWQGQLTTHTLTVSLVSSQAMVFTWVRTPLSATIRCQTPSGQTVTRVCGVLQSLNSLSLYPHQPVTVDVSFDILPGNPVSVTFDYQVNQAPPTSVTIPIPFP